MNGAKVLAKENKTMDELFVALGVAGLFLLRVGLPVLALIALGIMVDRWQRQRESEYEGPARRKPNEEGLRTVHDVRRVLLRMTNLTRFS